MGRGSREHDLLGVGNNFSNLILCYSRKVENIRGGESGVMCCELTEAENVERIFFFNFFCEELHKPVSQKLRGLRGYPHITLLCLPCNPRLTGSPSYHSFMSLL